MNQNPPSNRTDAPFIFLTRRIRLPKTDIPSVRPSRDGQGATVVTSRGAMRVCEDYSSIIFYLYDGLDVTPGKEEK